MGIADAILDLVSSGTTLRENNLKEIEGGIVLESQVSYLGPCQASDFVVSRMPLKEGLQATAFVTVNFACCLYHIFSYNILQAVLVASRKALIQRRGALDITHEILERLEAHLRAVGQFTVCHVLLCILFKFSFMLLTHLTGRLLQTWGEVVRRKWLREYWVSHHCLDCRCALE